MSCNVSSSSEDEQPYGAAGNLQFQRKFSVADYSDILNQSGTPAVRSTAAAASSANLKPPTTNNIRLSHHFLPQHWHHWCAWLLFHFAGLVLGKKQTNTWGATPSGTAVLSRVALNSSSESPPKKDEKDKKNKDKEEKKKGKKDEKDKAKESKKDEKEKDKEKKKKKKPEDEADEIFGSLDEDEDEDPEKDDEEEGNGPAKKPAAKGRGRGGTKKENTKKNKKITNKESKKGKKRGDHEEEQESESMLSKMKDTAAGMDVYNSPVNALSLQDIAHLAESSSSSSSSKAYPDKSENKDLKRKKQF